MKLALTFVAAAALALPLRAEEKPAAKGGWGAFFQNLRNTLSQSAVSAERKKARGSHVAAVRGKEQVDMADPGEPTLKGDAKTKRAQKAAKLDLELAKAVELIEKGSIDDGIKALEAFKAKHPKHRPDDVDKAIEGAKALKAERAAGGEKAPAATE